MIWGTRENNTKKICNTYVRVCPTVACTAVLMSCIFRNFLFLGAWSKNNNDNKRQFRSGGPKLLDLRC